MVDVEKLKAGLSKLRGIDLEAVEREERLAGNQQPLLDVTKSFQVRLAARALDVNVHDLKELPLKEYNLVASIVFSFLFGTEKTSSQ